MKSKRQWKLLLFLLRGVIAVSVIYPMKTTILHSIYSTDLVTDGRRTRSVESSSETELKKFLVI